MTPAHDDPYRPPNWDPAHEPAHEQVDAAAPEPVPPSGDPPRVWTAFVAMLVAFVASVVAGGLTSLAFVLPVVLEDPTRPPDPTALTDAVLTPFAVLIQALPAQLMILLTALVAAILSPEPTKQRLGLVDSGLSFFEWIVVGLSSFAVAAVGMGLAHLLTFVLAPDPTAEILFSRMTYPIAIPWILFIAFAPGFSEELLFRGYVQRRLLARWSPPRAIYVSSFVFALFHLMPHTVLFAFVLGVWFGYLAWKTGSVWPTILGHILVNGTWNILNVSRSLLKYPDSVFWTASALLSLLGLVALVMTVGILKRYNPAVLPAAAPATEPAGPLE